MYYYPELSGNYNEAIIKKEDVFSSINEGIRVSATLRDINKDKVKEFKKYNVRIDPSRIQEKINQLEQQIETETSFKKEQKLMEEIKKLKKTYEENSKLVKVIDETKELEKEIDESRSKADEFHKKIQELAKDSDYANFIEISKKINNLRKEQEEAFNKFIDMKNKFNEINGKFKEKAKQLNEIKKTVTDRKTENQHGRERRDRAIIKQKQEEVEKKMKTKMRLTTEDIIVMQGEK